MAQKLWDFWRRNCGTGRKNYGILHGADVQRHSEDPVLSGTPIFLPMALVDADAALRAALRGVGAGGSEDTVAALVGSTWGLWWPLGGTGRGPRGGAAARGRGTV